MYFTLSLFVLYICILQCLAFYDLYKLYPFNFKYYYFYCNLLTDVSIIILQ